MKFEVASLKSILLIYAVFIVGAFFYFIVLQQFGYRGLAFSISGADHILTPLDVIIVLTFLASGALLLISFAAFTRKRSAKLFVLSLAFFFFTVREFLFMLENFFPAENIYTGNAVQSLDLLILLSFFLLLYRAK